MAPIPSRPRLAEALGIGVSLVLWAGAVAWIQTDTPVACTGQLAAWPRVDQEAFDVWWQADCDRRADKLRMHANWTLEFGVTERASGRWYESCEGAHGCQLSATIPLDPGECLVVEATLIADRRGNLTWVTEMTEACRPA